MSRISGETVREEETFVLSPSSFQPIHPRPIHTPILAAARARQIPLAPSPSPSVRTPHHEDDVMLILTGNSDDTLVDQTIVCGVAALMFNQVNTRPIVTQRLQQGTYIFESDASAENGDQYIVHTKGGALFTLVFMLIRRPNQLVCKVMFRTVSVWILYYRLVFEDGEDVYLYCNNSYNPSVDFVIKGTRLRVLGLAGGGSIAGRDLAKILVLRDGAETLDGKVTKKNVEFIKNGFYSAIENRDRLGIAKFVNDTVPLINVPLAMYMDAEGKLGKYSKCGTIKSFTCGDEQLEMRLLAVLLVIREQEGRKLRGSR